MPDNISDNISTTGRVAVGNSLTGEIETTNDSDAYAVELVAGRTYRIDLEGAATDKGTLADPFLRWLRDSSGNGLHGTRDYDGAEGLNPRQVFTPQVSGTYYITASGQGDSVGTYTLTVTDTSAPVFGASAYGFQLAENTDGGATRMSLGTVSATDPEGVSVDYSIVGGNESASFEIDAASGELFYKGSGEDYESDATSYDLTVRASDGQLTADTTVTVTVTDVAEAPAFGQQDYTFELAENADGSTTRVSLGTVSAIDPEGASVGYSIVGGNESGSFEIDVASGELFYVGAGEDYEAGAAQFGLEIRASDGTAHSDVTVTVSITDVEKYAILEQTANVAPQFTYANYAFELPENADGATVPVSLDLVQATDPDNNPIAYSIEGGNESGSFEIDATSGELSYRGADEDYESETTRYDLTVRASDGSLHSDVTVTVNITDVAEAPAFGQDSYAFDLAEKADGATLGLSLGRVTATDPESSPITYSIEAGDPDGLFAIDPETGALSYRGAGEDYESGTTSYDLTVRASDPVLHSDVTVTINVTDVADGEESVSLQQAASVSEPNGQDLPANTSTTGVAVVGGSARGKIASNGDRDWFAVELEANKTYRIDLEGSGSGGGILRDPQLYGIHDANGDLIAYTTNDDGGERLNSQVYFTAEETGTYYVAAGAHGTWQGAYRLSVADVTDTYTDDFAAGTGTRGRVAVDDSARGEIGHEGDRDWFAIKLVADREYLIDLKGLSTGDGTLGDPYLRGIHDANGDLIARTENDDGGFLYNSRVKFTAPNSGIYYVAAGAFGDGVGAYRLSVADRDDFADGTRTTGSVRVGGSVRGRIDDLDDSDWFRVTLVAGMSYQIDLKGDDTGHGTLPDPYLGGIHDADGVLIADTTNDDGGTGLNSRVTFTAEETGIYYVEAWGAANPGDIGTYTLSVSYEDDYAADNSTTGTVAVGVLATGEIEFDGDRDWFAIELETGRTYRIDLNGSGTGDGTLPDPWLVGIHNEDGELIEYTTNDDGGAGFNSQVYFTAEETGTYYAAAGTSQDGGVGSYKLSVTDVDDFVARTWTTGTVAVGVLATGEIELDGDRDWFAIELEAGQTYRIDLEGSDTGGGTLPDPWLVGIHNEGGDPIVGTTDDDGAGLNSRVYFAPDDAGTYYVAAGASQNGGVGSYKLSVTAITDDYAADTGTAGAVVCQSASKFDPLSACNIDPLSGTAEVVPVVNRGDPCGFV